MKKFFDSHCHLLTSDCIETCKTALKSHQHFDEEFLQMNVMSTEPKDWNSVCNLYKTYPSLLIPSFGVHPWKTKEIIFDDNIRNEMKSLLIAFPSSIVGEIGIDKGKGADKDIQLQIFKSQYELATELQRPCSIHVVGYYGEILKFFRKQIKGNCSHPPNVMIHSFGGSAEITKSLVKIPWLYFSISPLIFKKKDWEKIVLEIPLKQLLIESDQDNPDEWFPWIYSVLKKIAALKNLSEEELSDITFENGKKFISF
jgi:TatD DNase family protein